MNFSILMSLYKKEKSSYLDSCLESIYKQTIKCDNIVIVHDGPLTPELYSILDKWKYFLQINEVKLPKNIGLGRALNEGLKYCKYDLVGRVDTDDINLPERFEKQYRYMQQNKNVAVTSSHIAEFDQDCDQITGKRMVPLYDRLHKVIHIRNPINHMTVMFRKKVIIKVGGYQHFPNMEDYYLWVRVYDKGYIISNMDEVLVLARVGNGMLERRQGWSYFKTEIKFLKKLIHMNSVKRKPKIILIFIIRACTRILPPYLLSIFYRSTRK
ncbi:glycosyltransferase [Photobacterium phosphoreum]|uniref:glycosyltransferase n=1 Tax=Photobacterium phosphoreum TaxID=659 RepID=UPI001E5FC013|nr:glycosyltransferase [Photobacterium phosphoreum]